MLIACYDGQIISLVGTKQFKQQGVMGNELVMTQEEQDSVAMRQQQTKEQRTRIAELESEVLAMEREVKKMEEEICKQEEANK